MNGEQDSLSRYPIVDSSQYQMNEVQDSTYLEDSSQYQNLIPDKVLTRMIIILRKNTIKKNDIRKNSIKKKKNHAKN